MNICGYYPESINEGEGMRAVLFISGCRHRCPGCFNPETWNFKYGEVFTLERQHEIIAEIAANPLLDGLTIAGGDPFFSAEEVVAFIHELRTVLPEFPIWIYSGYTYDQDRSRFGRRSRRGELHQTPAGDYLVLLRIVAWLVHPFSNWINFQYQKLIYYSAVGCHRKTSEPFMLAGMSIMRWLVLPR